MRSWALTTRSPASCATGSAGFSYMAWTLVRHTPLLYSYSASTHSSSSPGSASGLGVRTAGGVSDVARRGGGGGKLFWRFAKAGGTGGAPGGRDFFVTIDTALAFQDDVSTLPKD